MSGYYDELTNTTYYDPQMVMNITEYDSDGDKDSDVFIIYDEEQDAYYLYGSRGGSKYVRYTKVFYCMNDLYNFISITMGFNDNHTVSLSINYMANLTNYDEYDDIKELTCSECECIVISKKFIQNINDVLLCCACNPCETTGNYITKELFEEFIQFLDKKDEICDILYFKNNEWVNFVIE